MTKKEIVVFAIFCMAMMTIGGFLTYYILFPCPEINVTSGVTIDTVYVVEYDTLEFTKIDTIFKEMESKPSPNPGELITYIGYENEYASIEMDIFSKCPIDSVGLRLFPKPQIIERPKMVVSRDSIVVIEIKEPVKFTDKLTWSIIGFAVAGLVVGITK